MSQLLAESFQQIANRARFYEYLGYFLVVLCAVILIGGVSWSVGKRFDGRMRVVYAAAGLSVLTFILVATATILLIAFERHSPTVLRSGTRRVLRESPLDPPKMDKLVVEVAADRTLTIGEMSMPGDQFTDFLEQAATRWDQDGVELENVSVEIRCDPELPYASMIEVMDACRGMGIVRILVKSNERGD